MLSTEYPVHIPYVLHSRKGKRKLSTCQFFVDVIMFVRPIEPANAPGEIVIVEMKTLMEANPQGVSDRLNCAQALRCALHVAQTECAGACKLDAGQESPTTA